MTPDMYDEMTGAWTLLGILVLAIVWMGPHPECDTRPDDGQEVGDGE